MKKTLFLAVLFAAATAFAGIAQADSTASYSISGTYANGTTSTPLTQAGNNFTMNFSLPTQPASLIGPGNSMSGDDFYTFPLTVNYTNNGVASILTNVTVGFYNAFPIFSSQAGGFFVDYCANPIDLSCNTGFEYQWNFAGPQQYKGPETNPTLIPSSYQFSGQLFLIYKDFSKDPIFSDTASGTVNGSTTATPETSSLGMLMLGFAGLALLVKFKN